MIYSIKRLLEIYEYTYYITLSSSRRLIKSVISIKASAVEYNLRKPYWQQYNILLRSRNETNLLQMIFSRILSK